MSFLCLAVNWLTDFFQGNARTTGLLSIAKENNLDIEIVETLPNDGVSAEYLKKNPLGQIPTFEQDDGFLLTESLAIAVYCELLQFLSLVPGRHKILHLAHVYAK